MEWYLEYQINMGIIKKVYIAYAIWDRLDKKTKTKSIGIIADIS